ncbi:S-layer homology domain-containing protein [Paenibacillus sp.]|uniref:S-layer homology domain-containing protein n=1 Tax=Paenibacillus sp. TaxID=58172 RepID=UPI002D64C8DD|nr:S-layer homology domain-containing protein [Paenibacillus sp.]HZG85314.1 S-layer homology domain-containing protein [Paenibacillus sp.]
MKSKVRIPFAVLTSAALSASLLLGTGAVPAHAETTPTTQASAAVTITFPDIVPTHWARGSVAKLAAAGIIRGYQDGNFKPSQEVTQQEAVVMVIRMIGLEDEANQIMDGVVTGLQEDAFFTKYVVKALEERILDLTAETVAASTGDTPWGKRPATREWVAKLVVRAIGERPAAGGLTFADASAVSADAAGYVAKSQELGLVTGFTDNTFQPKTAVTRAQIVTILSRADKYIPDDESRYASGTVAAVDGTTLQVRTSTGATRSFGLNGESLVFDAEGRQLDVADLVETTPVRVLYQNGQAYYIEISPATEAVSVQLETFEGELAALDIAAGTLVLEHKDGSLEPFKLAANATVTDARGTGLSLSQLTEGSDLRLQRAQGAADVTAVVVLEAAFNATGTAVAQAVNAASRTVTFADAQGAAVTYPVDANASLKLKGAAIASLDTLQVGDTFAYEIKDGVIVSLDITVQKTATVSGQYQGYAGNTITIMENGTEPRAYLLKTNVEVKIEGLTGTTIDDLQQGDLVQLRISGATNQVESITVSNRNVTKIQGAAIESLKDDYLTVRDDKGKPYLLYITSRSKFVLDGTEMTKQLYTAYLTTGRKVNISVSADQLVRLDVVTKVSGTVTELNTASRTITVRTANGETVKVPYAQYVSIEVPQQSSAGLADIGVGSVIHLNMGMNSDAASSIQVERSFVYTLTSANASTRTLYVTDAKGTPLTFTLPSDARVLGRDGQPASLSALAAGNPIVLNYAGRAIISVQEPAATLGKVSALDTTGGRLSVTDLAGNVKSFSLSGGINVQKGNTLTASASALQLNDRVLAVTDAQGKPYVFVARTEVRKFSSYDASKHEIALKIAKLGDQSKYALSPSVTVRTSADAPLALNQLKENDQITIYLLQGKIVEIVK